jgi:hypothetical protein
MTVAILKNKNWRNMISEVIPSMIACICLCIYKIVSRKYLNNMGVIGFRIRRYLLNEFELL